MKRTHSMGSLTALLLFGLFAVCIVGVLLSGAGSFRRLTERDQQSYEQRTCMQFLATKVRHCASAADLRVGTFGSGDCLELTEETEGVVCCTRVYCYDGWLRELYTSGEDDFSPEDGEKLLEAQALRLCSRDGFLEIEVEAGTGAPQQMTLYLRGGEGAAS